MKWTAITESANFPANTKLISSVFFIFLGDTQTDRRTDTTIRIVDVGGENGRQVGPKESQGQYHTCIRDWLTQTYFWCGSCVWRGRRERTTHHWQQGNTANTHTHTHRDEKEIKIPVLLCISTFVLADEGNEGWKTMIDFFKELENKNEKNKNVNYTLKYN